MVLALLEPIKATKSLEFEQNIFEFNFAGILFLGRFEKFKVPIQPFQSYIEAESAG